MADLAKIVEDLSALTVLEAAELSKLLEEKWGVSAAAPVAMAMPAGGGAAPAEAAEEQTEFTVVLIDGGDKKINAIKEVRGVRPDLGLKEAKDLVDGAPKAVKEAIPKADADAALKKLGLEGKISNVAIASKLGFGYEAGKYEAVYSAVVQFSDDRFSPPRQRTMSFTLRGEDTNPTRLDSQLATDVTELFRRLVNDEL